MTTQLAARPFGPKRNHRRSGTRVIAFLGTGPMAANLAPAGLERRGWARPARDAAGLVKDGATVAASPAEAVQGAGILITMLADGPSTDEVWNGSDGRAAAGPSPTSVSPATRR